MLRPIKIPSHCQNNIIICTPLINKICNPDVERESLKLRKCTLVKKKKHYELNETECKKTDTVMCSRIRRGKEAT